MSEYLAAAAQAMGMPESVVRRSAEAKAAKTGSTVEEVLKAWAGGETAPAAPAAKSPEQAQDEPAAAPLEPESPPVAEPPPAPPPSAVVVEEEPSKAPILEGRRDRPFAVALGAVGIFLITVLLSFIAPGSAEETNTVYSSAIPLSERGLAGRSVYLSQGCAACHTQMVRPVVADAGLGGVTLADTNQVLGNRRYGPDLAHVGSRYPAAADLRKVLQGETGHLSYGSLAETDLQNLITYLLESR